MDRGTGTALSRGDDHLYRVRFAASELVAEDRLWAVTLITTEQEKPALSAKLAQSGSFAFPIRLFTVQEAADAVHGLSRDEQEQRGDASARELTPERGEWVVPEHWLTIAEPSRFAEWKADLTRQANQVKQERERVEGELADWQAALRKLQAFLDRYPLAAQQELKQKQLTTQARIAGLARELEGLDQSLELNRQTIEKRKAAMEEMGNAILQHGIWLQSGRQYLLFHDEAAKLTQELVPLRARQQLLEEQKGQEERAEARLLKRLEEERLQQQDVQLQLQLLRRDEWYDKVQAYAPLPAEGLIEEWKAARRDLELERLRIVQERSQLEEQLTREQERVNELGKAMDSLRREHAELLLDRELPADVSTHQSKSWQLVEELRSQTVLARRNHEQADRRLREQQGAIATLLQQFAEQFGSSQEPERIDEPLDQAESALAEMELSLTEEGEQLKQQLARTNRFAQELDKVLELWNKHLLVHQLEDVRLTPAIIGEADRTEFVYKRMHYVEDCLTKLSGQQKEFADNRSRMLEGRQHFKDFCIKKVNDVKLRQMTIQGIDTKEHYEEIREFQQAMEQRIQMAIHIAEQNLQTRDQEQQQYIQHIHAHLRQVVHELKEVPKKTRVNTEDGWRDIYSFAIPDWEEQEGKERIRGHLDWIMDKLDSYAEKGQADWQEQQTAMRKDLDKWLDTRALLQMVLQGEGMKVSCRKVTNDQQVTRASYSWEQSNRWSGGEKWSKNMTLFLGLLNYVAEKKHYIEARMKRHRTVILDNPFGKASSDHVLSPVFFIAEQLGFQFIALTAHVEGKFLQDYFPIVYSCRLRHAADSSKQIIEASQQVQTAYFRDHDPLTLERIGHRVSQLELF
jgi:DNA repair exonuclease SbcCD ATPase subunit